MSRYATEYGRCPACEGFLQVGGCGRCGARSIDADPDGPASPARQQQIDVLAGARGRLGAADGVHPSAIINAQSAERIVSAAVAEMEQALVTIALLEKAL